jgi:hypothetical protein
MTSVLVFLLCKKWKDAFDIYLPLFSLFIRQQEQFPYELKI